MRVEPKMPHYQDRPAEICTLQRRAVRVLDMSVEKAANLQIRCPTWVRDWLRRYDEEGSKASGILPDAGGLQESREMSSMK